MNQVQTGVSSVFMSETLACLLFILDLQKAVCDSLIQTTGIIFNRLVQFLSHADVLQAFGLTLQVVEEAFLESEATALDLENVVCESVVVIAGICLSVFPLLAEGGEREAKSLAYFSQSYIDQPPVLMDGVPQEYTDYDDQLDGPEFPGQDGNEILSRARPSRPQPDSPVYYIRLPPAPYVLVPGVGYVSRPPTLRPPPVVQQQQPQPLPQQQQLHQPQRPSAFINLPVKFVSNGRPTGIYSYPQDSPITNLDKGPYSFNGRPSDIFLLRNTYNALYEDALQNFYP